MKETNLGRNDVNGPRRMPCWESLKEIRTKMQTRWDKEGKKTHSRRILATIYHLILKDESRAPIFVKSDKNLERFTSTLNQESEHVDYHTVHIKQEKPKQPPIVAAAAAAAVAVDKQFGAWDVGGKAMKMMQKMGYQKVPTFYQCLWPILTALVRDKG